MTTLESVTEMFTSEGMMQHSPPRQGNREMAGKVPGAPHEEGGIEVEAPEMGIGEAWADLLIGACAGGAFIGGFAAAPAVGAVAVAVVRFSTWLGYRMSGS